jgi:D-alanyl-lipoteichoic acid acyltransferase DltB (MBOAT superfamily)
MLPTSGDLVARLAHLRGIVFTEFALVGLAAALVVWAARRQLVAVASRERLVLAASLGVLAWFVGAPLAAAFVAYALALHALVETGARRSAARAGVLALLAVMVAAPVVWIGALGDGPAHRREIVAFATNMALLRCLAYARERWTGALATQPAARVLLALFFFPTFVNGPVETTRDLAAETWAGNDGDLGAGLARVGRGAAKVALVALVLPLDWMQWLAAGPTASAARLWGLAALLWVWFYLSFSAWSDVAIGLGRLCGRTVRENFDRPWLATDPGDFWRRWHVSFGRWLRDVVYVPLGGNRRHRAANVLVVFLASAAWHVWGTLKLLGFGYFPPLAWAGLFVWGLLHAVAVVVAGRRRTEPAAAAASVARGATLAFSAFAWVPFFAPASVPPADLLRMLLRMLCPWI